MRWVLGAVGVAMGLYGVSLVVSRDHDLLNLAIWLAAGVVLHDAVLAPAALALSALLPRLPRVARGPLVVGALVLGSATLLAVPVLGRFGARDDNPTLLPRDYVGGWAVLAAAVVLGVAVGVILGARRGARRSVRR
jgi:hypothetical protein